MHKPKEGERVKIVADTCKHRIRLGRIVKITAERDEQSWWVGAYGVFVVAEDISRLGLGIRKTLKNLERSVRRAIEEATSDRPALKSVAREIVAEVSEESCR